MFRQDLKATVFIPGERAAGIRESHIDLDLGTNPFCDDEVREDFRKRLTELVNDTIASSGNSYCVFNDECMDCSGRKDNVEVECDGHTFIVFKCKNPKCISNLPEN